MLHQCTFTQNRPKSVYMRIDPMPILHIQCQFIKGSLPKTKWENVGIFPKWGPPLPLFGMTRFEKWMWDSGRPPCLGMTCFFFKKMMAYFAF